MRQSIQEVKNIHVFLVNWCFELKKISEVQFVDVDNLRKIEEERQMPEALKPWQGILDIGF